MGIGIAVSCLCHCFSLRGSLAPLSYCCCWAGWWFFNFLLIKYVIPEALLPLLMGLALSNRSFLKLAGIDSVGCRGNFSRKPLWSLLHPDPFKNLATQASTIYLCLCSPWSLQLWDQRRFTRLPRVAAVLMPKQNQMLLSPSVLLPGALVQPQSSFKWNWVEASCLGAMIFFPFLCKRFPFCLEQII